MINNYISIQYCYEYLVSYIPLGLLLYSHIPTAAIAVLFGGYILLKDRSVKSTALFVVCAAFAAWSLFDLVTWFAFLGAGETMFAWSILDMLALIFFFFAYYFLYAFIEERDLPLWQKIAGAVLILPTMLATMFGKNIIAFDATICEAVENTQITLYPYIAQGLILLWLLIFACRAYLRTTDATKRKIIVLATTGVTLFLGFFFSATAVVALLISYGVGDNAYNYTIYGLFGMPVLLMYLGYLIVRFKAFNLEMFSAQALIVALVALISSQYTFVTSLTNKVLVAITLSVTGILGIVLIRSVRKEIAAREHIERLARSLDKANTRLQQVDRLKSEFVSIASHQLRSPVTAIKGYSSMLLEGTYGKVDSKMREAIERIYESGKNMGLMIEDFLNVSRIEQGNMKYDKKIIDICGLIDQVIADQKPAIEAKGLTLYFESNIPGVCRIYADLGKIKQVLTNLIDNAIKYTPKGSIKVAVARGGDDTVRISVTDSGIGMSPETIEKLFQKFSRANNANSVDVSGTGLGLYVALQMVDAHHGKIWAESKGDGKGSTFILELPIKEL